VPHPFRGLIAKWVGNDTARRAFAVVLAFLSVIPEGICFYAASLCLSFCHSRRERRVNSNGNAPPPNKPTRRPFHRCPPERPKHSVARDPQLSFPSPANSSRRVIPKRRTPGAPSRLCDGVSVARDPQLSFPSPPNSSRVSSHLRMAALLDGLRFVGSRLSESRPGPPSFAGVGFLRRPGPLATRHQHHRHPPPPTTRHAPGTSHHGQACLSPYIAVSSRQAARLGLTAPPTMCHPESPRVWA
jgi:hypothetical protein